jgi:hypothetical protein
MVSSFPGENACYQEFPFIQHFVWTLVGVEEEGIDMGVLDHVKLYFTELEFRSAKPPLL